MRASLLFTIAAIMYLIFGVAAILVPDQLAAIYGATLDSVGLFVTRNAGGAILGFALLCWMVRNEVEIAAGRAALLVNALYCLIGAIVYVMALSQGVINAIGWISVVLYGLLTLGFAYFYWTRPEPVARST